MIIFDTPGLLDRRALTVMGLSVKPSTPNPIGYFGTGLKYAVAVSLRLGALFSIWIGEDEYIFELHKREFRGAEFDQIVMRKRDRFAVLARFTDEELPFTVEYGRNWKPWMVVRELESNTLDEKGVSYKADDPMTVRGDAERTRITIVHQEIEAAWEARSEIFLPGGEREGSGVQLLAGDSRFVYWRGLKVFELNKQPLFSYNFLDEMELTEDRTLRAEFYARNALANWIVQHDDEEVIEKIITAKTDNWEHGLEPNPYFTPSRAFHNVMMRHPKNVSSGFYGYYQKFDETPRQRAYNLTEVHPAPWELLGNAVYDAKGVKIFDEPYGYQGRWPKFGAALIERAGMGASTDAAKYAAKPDPVPEPEQIEPSSVLLPVSVEDDDI